MRHSRRTPGVAVQYKKDWQKQPLHYPVLCIEMLSKEDKELVIRETAELVTGEMAIHFFNQHIEFLRKQDGKNICPLWRIDLQLQTKDIVILVYKGIQVLLFYKRQINQIEFRPGDPIPEAKLDDPADAWMRIDLMGMSAREQRKVTLRKLQESNKSIQAVSTDLEDTRKLVESLESIISQKNEQIVKQKIQIKKLKGQGK